MRAGPHEGGQHHRPYPTAARSAEARAGSRPRQRPLAAAGTRALGSGAVGLIEGDNEQPVGAERGRSFDARYPLAQEPVDASEAARTAVDAFRIVSVIAEVGCDEHEVGSRRLPGEILWQPLEIHHMTVAAG